ncbi:MAG: universal stress protein [Pleurocapsa sp. SU_196_0]|nr:universal stress protein [Pleurocapsa sp. SU_196_0]
MYQRLLVPVDTSPCSEIASSLAMRLARAFGSHVTLLHVLSRDDVVTRTNAQRLLERLSEGARHLPKLILEPPASDVADSIVTVCEREASDMILIGTHAHARLERKALGERSARRGSAGTGSGVDGARADQKGRSARGGVAGRRNPRTLTDGT